MSFFTSLKYQK